MNKQKRNLGFSFVTILVPMLYGLVVYSQLPTKMATHFSIHNTPNGFTNRPLAVIGLPVFMCLIQAVGVFSSFSKKNKDRDKRFFSLIIWLIPIISGVVYLSTIFYNLGYAVNIWRIAVLLIGFVFIAMGNFLPTLSQGYTSFGFHIKPKTNVTWRKVRRLMGIGMFLGGILLIISVFTTPIVSVVLLVIIICYILFLSILSTRKN